MKKIIIVILFVVINVGLSFSQAKKPTLMVVPSDVWCNQNGYMMEFDNQGTIMKIPNYKKAFQENAELLTVISKINSLFADRGFPLKDMASVVKSLELNSAEDAMMASKETGAAAAENPVDKLKAVAKADVILQVTWQVNQIGPKRSITFNLQGLDSYTDKQVAAASGTGAPSFTAELPVLLEESVISHLDNFTNSLQNYFDDILTNGREVTLRIKVWEDWGEDLETEFGEDEDELGDLIEDWLADNTVNGNFNTTDASENMMFFEQVRIPLYYERNGKQRAMDTRRFAKGLSKYLKNDLMVANKVTIKGLGQATVYLGGK